MVIIKSLKDSLKWNPTWNRLTDCSIASWLRVSFTTASGRQQPAGYFQYDTFSWIRSPHRLLAFSSKLTDYINPPMAMKAVAFCLSPKNGASVTSPRGNILLITDLWGNFSLWEFVQGLSPPTSICMRLPAAHYDIRSVRTLRSPLSNMAGHELKISHCACNRLSTNSEHSFHRAFAGDHIDHETQSEWIWSTYRYALWLPE